MKFLRYPGGKTKLLSFLTHYLPTSDEIKGIYIEPFVGGGSVYLYIKPQKAHISDLNPELITLYKAIKLYPHKVWETFKSFPEGKDSYYQIRDMSLASKPIYFKAARILYLNRTCFKGMWRHNFQGNFNVGYGGENRRWVITHDNIMELSRVFRGAKMEISDFEAVLEQSAANDFIFLDPPYKPGDRDLREKHYSNGRFMFDDQVRLAKAVKQISKKEGLKWAMTNSAHEDILKLYSNFNIIKLPFGTSDKPGILTRNSGEVLITNY
jgi:DNA adenine methylase